MSRFSQLVERFRPSFFSRQEWWFNIAMFVVWVPFGNYFFFGPKYLSDINVFVVGSITGQTGYAISIVVLTILVRRIVAHFPTFRQTIVRTAVMVFLVGIGVIVLSTAYLWIYSLIPVLGIRFDWEMIGPIWLLDLVFVFLFSIGLNVVYAYQQWKEEKLEIELLKSKALEQEIDALKQKVKPHFLFNSLDSISALIYEDNRLAEQMVDHLANVYRYMLQSNSQEQVLLGDELQFIASYASLLRVRFGDRIRISLPEVNPRPAAFISPQSLQVLIDHALENNVMSAGSPLAISVFINEKNITVQNTLRQKRTLLQHDRRGLGNLVTRYKMLGAGPVVILEQENIFSVSLPLLNTE